MQKKDGSIEKVARFSVKYIGGQSIFGGTGLGQNLENMKMYIFFFSKYSTKLILIIKDNCFLVI